MPEPSPLVAVTMGSDVDLRVMRGASDALAAFGVAHDMRVLSTQHAPEAVASFARSAEERGLQIIIAGAGGAAHLPGMLAALTDLPVIGVPITSTPLQGLDALLSIVQMPKGVPVATVAVDGGRNAGMLAVRMIGATDPVVRARLRSYREAERSRVEEVGAAVRRSAEAREVALR